MNIALIGAAGGVGRRVAAQAVAAGHTVRGLVRTQEQADMLSLHGANPVLGDLLGEWQKVLQGTGAVVWAAGAGAAGQHQQIDGQALIAVADALGECGPHRLVVVSSMGVDRPEQMPPLMAAVLRIKAVSDAHVQASNLDWTIVRPGGLTDEPGKGTVQAAPKLAGGGNIARDDVATVVLACLTTPSTIHHTFEVVAGQHSISESLAGLANQD